MSSDPLPPLTRYPSILSNILTGTHPTCPSSPPSALEHFARTRFTSVIKPSIAEAWELELESRQDPFANHDAVQPSKEFSEQVLRNVFNALSTNDIKAIEQEIEHEWDGKMKEYHDAIREMYGEIDIQRYPRAIDDVLHPILTALEGMTRQKILLWVGGQIDTGMSLINVTTDPRTSEAPLILPNSQKALFEQAASNFMSRKQKHFLADCMQASTSHLSPNVLEGQALRRILNDNNRMITPRQVMCYDLQSSPITPLPSETPRVIPKQPLSIGPKPNSLPSTKINEKMELPPSIHVNKSSATRKRKHVENLPALQVAPAKKVRRAAPSLSLGSPVKTMENKSSMQPRNESLPPISTLTPPTNSPLAPPRVIIASSTLALIRRGRPSRKSAPIPGAIQELIKNLPASAEWLSSALPDILRVNIGVEYYCLVTLLVDLESSYGFATNPVVRFSCTHRPPEIKRWISGGRGQRLASIVIEDLSFYAKGWWNWWRSLQPGWRVFDRDGKPITSSGNVGDWECMIVPGANGFLGVVASLYWWGCAVLGRKEKEKKEHMTGWERAVADCRWVMEGVLGAMKEKEKMGEPLTTGEVENENEVDNENEVENENEEEVDELDTDDDD